MGPSPRAQEDVVVSQNSVAQYRLQTTIILLMGTPKMGTPNFGKLLCRDTESKLNSPFWGFRGYLASTHTTPLGPSKLQASVACDCGILRE